MFCSVQWWIMKGHTSGDHSVLRALREVPDKDGAGGAHPKIFLLSAEVAAASCAGSGWFSKHFEQKTQVQNEAEPWPRKSIQAKSPPASLWA